MKIKYKLTILCLIGVLAICSCDNSNTNKSQTPYTTTSQTVGKQAIERKPSLSIAGTYSFGDDVELGPIGSVMIYPLTDHSALFFLDLCRGAPSYNTGRLSGEMTIRDHIGTYDSKKDGADYNCELKFEFSADALKITTNEESGDCGFGYAVYADNNYNLIDRSVPEYFITGESDTVTFSSLAAELYDHRLD